MTAVKWNALHSKLFEDLVAVLLSTLNPEVERIDGSGGDGGRDCQFRSDRGLVIWQMKYFDGRIASSQRRQIKRSLLAAADHNPTEWWLVLPIDLTPGETEWFDSLRAEVPFTIGWMGRTWLDGNLASHPQIVRYFIDDAKSEVVEMLTELHQEEAALADGVPDAVERLSKLAGRLNDLSPYYRFAIRLDGDRVEIETRPRYVGAEKDAPITVDFEVTFPPTEEGRALREALRQAIEFGDEVELPGHVVSKFDITAPDGIFGAPRGVDRLKVGPSVSGDIDLPADLQVLDGEGVLASLPATFELLRKGTAGGTLIGSDLAGCLSLRVKFDLRQQHATIQFTFESGSRFLPQVLVPAIRFMRAVPQADSFAVWSESASSYLVPPTQIDPGDWPEPDDEFDRFIEALARVQSATGRSFPVPGRFSQQDLDRIEFADKLLSGQSVEQTWTESTVGVVPGGLGPLLWQLREHDGAEVKLSGGDDLVVRVAGHDIRLGRAEHILDSVTVADREALEAIGDNDEPVDVIFVPCTSNRSRLRLIR